MESSTRVDLENLRTTDSAVRNQAFAAVLAATANPVDWAYEIWDALVATLNHKDNHQRAIAAQVLCNIAKSDPEQRMLKDFAALLAVTKDARFVTARHCLQALWQVGAVSPTYQQMVVDGLASRFHDCQAEKNHTLIRADIVHSLRKLYDDVRDESIKTTALALIESETDAAYRKKYAGYWKIKPASAPNQIS